jgi:hypothetical protein
MCTYLFLPADIRFQESTRYWLVFWSINPFVHAYFNIVLLLFSRVIFLESAIGLVIPTQILMRHGSLKHLVYIDELSSFLSNMMTILQKPNLQGLFPQWLGYNICF